MEQKCEKSLLWRVVGQTEVNNIHINNMIYEKVTSAIKIKAG